MWHIPNHLHAVQTFILIRLSLAVLSLLLFRCTLRRIRIGFRNPIAPHRNSFQYLQPPDWYRNWPRDWPEYDSKNQKYMLLGTIIFILKIYK